MRYLVVHVPEHQHVRYTTITRVDALTPTEQHTRKNILPVHFCFTPGEQETILAELAAKYPGEVFAPVELTTGVAGLPGPVQKLKIVDKGVIPV